MRELTPLDFTILNFLSETPRPVLAASLGKSMKEFKKGVAEVGEEEPGKPPAPPTALTATASRSCLACTTPLDPAWSHCPRCGAAAPGDAKSQESR
jgi:hypothetical protein